MILTPPSLKHGDTIAIVAPAKAIEKTYVDFAQSILEKAGYKVVIGKNTLHSFHYFSGTDSERLADFQEMLDDTEVKAILCARGGYGAIRIVDSIQWASQLRAPKWIIGFSDITVFHQKLNRFDVQSIHGTMPLNFKTNSEESFSTLFKALTGEPYEIKCANHSCNKVGDATGKLVGGNLSILYSLLGTNDQPNYQDTILFIEDVGEQLYNIDRMLYTFKKTGVFEQIKGLIVGGMTDLKDTETPTGFSIEEIILHQFEFRKIPIAFNFPAGHVTDNRALILGKTVDLKVNELATILKFN